MEETTPQKTLSNVPADWPGAWGIYKYSKQAVKLNVSAVLMLWVSTFAVAIVTGIVAGFAHALAMNILLRIVLELVGVWIGIALVFTYLASVRGKEITAGEALRQVNRTLFLNYVAMSIVSFFLVMFSFVLFVVPFFFVAPRLNLASYFLIDKNLGPIESIKASWAATKGNVGKVWGIIGATFAMVLLCLTILGIPFAIYFLFMYQAANAILYTFLTKKA